MKEIKWNATKEEIHVISRIADRAVKIAKDIGASYKKMDVIMDIETIHCNGNTLKLHDLLTADDINFMHDVFGIRRHIDRKTGQLKNCFLPRYSKEV